jgi:hypothetical protein
VRAHHDVGDAPGARVNDDVGELAERRAVAADLPTGLEPHAGQ